MLIRLKINFIISILCFENVEQMVQMFVRGECVYTYSGYHACAHCHNSVSRCQFLSVIDEISVFKWFGVGCNVPSASARNIPSC
jgi:hypothetical protein